MLEYLPFDRSFVLFRSGLLSSLILTLSLLHLLIVSVLSTPQLNEIHNNLRNEYISIEYELILLLRNVTTLATDTLKPLVTNYNSKKMMCRDKSNAMLLLLEMDVHVCEVFDSRLILYHYRQSY